MTKYFKKNLKIARKIWSALIREGLFGVYVRFVKYLYILDGYMFWHKTTLQRLTQASNRGVVVCSPNESWDIPMFQRPQQLGRQFASQGYLYLHCLQNPDYDRVLGFRQLKKNLYLTNCHAIIFKKLSKFTYIVNNATHPSIDESFLANLKKTKDMVLVYDYLDHYSTDLVFYPDWLKQIKARHEYLVKNADVVLCVSKLLADEVAKKRRQNVQIVPNGCDYEHFYKAKPIRDKEIVSIQKRGKIIGYYGALAKWLDYGLINFLAKMRPNYQVVIIGEDFDSSMKTLKNLPNIHYLGIKHYSVLPRYAKHFDVSIIPFKTEIIGQSASPIKMYEYMALGRPIVSSNIAEARKYRSVLTVDNKEEFVLKIDRALKLKNNNDYLNLLKVEAKNNTWAKRIAQVLRAIERVENDQNHQR